MLMKNEEAVKLIVNTLKDSLSKYVGEASTERTAVELKSHMASVLVSLVGQMGSSAPTPKIKVTIDGSVASFHFYDPNTDELISFETWISRAVEGYYG